MGHQMRVWPHVWWGLAAWGVACLLPLDGDGVAWWVVRFVLLAVLVWVPLALRLVEGAAPQPLARMIRRLHPWCAALLLASTLLPAGLLAAGLAVPWLLWTMLLGVRGLLRLREHPLAAADEFCLSVSMVALPVGGIWLLASRAGVPLAGFYHPMTLLTSMHFHYAGLLMPTVVGLAGRLLPVPGAANSASAPAYADTGWALYRVLGPAAALGPWLVAVGITVGGAAEAVGGSLFAALLAAVAAVLLLRATPHVADPLGRALLILALLATWPAMGLAALYALSQAGLAALSLETMALVHGPLLALGFAGGSLLALARIRPAPRRP